VPAELARRDLVPEVWLPDSAVQAERERARFRLHLVKHRTMLKNRIHQTLIAHGQPRPTANLFTQRGRDLLNRLALPEPWRGTLQVSLALIEQLDRRIDQIERDLRCLGAGHRYVPQLCTVHSPNCLRWALIEAVHTTARYSLTDNSSTATAPATAAAAAPPSPSSPAPEHAEAIWSMLTRNQPFAPASAENA
jgi:hypothetical protein